MAFKKTYRILVGAAALTLLLAQIACGSPNILDSTPIPTPTSTSTATAPATPASSPTPTPTLHADPPMEEILQIEESANTTDVEITMNDSPDPAVPGEVLAYTLMVRNKGPNSANSVRVVVILPPEVSYVSDTGGCVENTPGTLTCDLGYLEARESSQFVVTAMIDADVVLNAGGPMTITNETSVVNMAGPHNLLFPFDHVWPDLDPSNNIASEETQVISR